MKLLLVGLMLLASSMLFAQSERLIYMIRSNGDNLALGLSSNGTSKYSFTAYGKIEVSTGVDHNKLAYIFHGQEYDSDLGLYFLPSRLYSAAQGRFMMPDPESQYHSPYLFVGADPINYTDRDGKAGKPLVFYSQEHNYPNGINPSMMDVMNEVPDAYYVPLSDFMNGEVGDLSEWNGNVYFKGHMETGAGEEIEVERSTNPKLMKSRLNNLKRIKVVDEENYANMADAEGIGKSLRRLSDQRGIPVKKIIAGGCQGGEAAERMGMGYVQGGDRFMGRTLETAGLHPSKSSVTSGKITTSNFGKIEGLDRTRFSIGPAGSELLEDYYMKELEDGTEREAFYQHVAGLKNGNEVVMDYVEGDEFSKMVNGRVPKKLESDFLKFKFEY